MKAFIYSSLASDELLPKELKNMTKPLLLNHKTQLCISDQMTTEMNAKLCSVVSLIHLILLPSKNTTQTGIQSSKPMLHLPRGLFYKSWPALSRQDKPLHPSKMTEVTLMVTDKLIMSNEVLDMLSPLCFKKKINLRQKPFPSTFISSSPLSLKAKAWQCQKTI